MNDYLRRYAVFLLDGFSIDGFKIQVGTIKGYMNAINAYYKDQGHRQPFNWKDNSPASILLRAQEKFEQEPDKRNPLTEAMCVRMLARARDEDALSFEAAAWNFTAVGRYGGFRAQEFCMDSPKEIRYYVMPDGTEIVRAFTNSDFLFYDKDSIAMEAPLRNRRKIKIGGQRYKVQKNRMNGQVITQKCCPEYPEYCSPTNMLEIVSRAEMLGYAEPNDPLCVYQNKKGDVRFLTGQSMTDYYRTIALSIYPSMTKEELSLISTHSLRVFACTLLHEAGKDGSYIKLRLRWLSNCFEVYLRNTDRIRQQHEEALGGSNARMAKMVVDAMVNGDCVHIRGVPDLAIEVEDED